MPAELKNNCNILVCYYRPKPGGFCKRLFRAINALLDRGNTVHYLAVVPFPINHPSCHFHRFPWSESKTNGLLFWAVFHIIAPVQLLFLGIRYNINRLFAFGCTYALFLQPLRIIRQIPLTLFLRADTIENHSLKGRSPLLLAVEHVIEGVAIHRTRMYGVSKTLHKCVAGRHRYLKPSINGVLRNDVLVRENRLKQEKLIFPLRLGSVGILEPRKNQVFLLEVMEELPKEKAELFLYGVGPDEQFLRKKVQEKRLSDRVHFMGWVDSQNIWPEIDLLLMPSLHEGAPNAVLEGIGHGVPVLASAIPEHGEILQREMLFSLDSILDLIGQIERFVYDDEILFSFVDNQFELVTQRLKFDWNIRVSELICA